MKAISLSQPWCWAVVHPIVRKYIENRSWMPPITMIGETIAIHAAKSWDDDKMYFGHTPIGYLLHLGFEPPARKDLYATSAIVGVATIDRIVSRPDTLAEDQKRWYFGPFGWVLTNVRVLPAPITCPGKQGLWTVPPPFELEINTQLRPLTITVN